jgi:hypothetical protein
VPVYGAALARTVLAAQRNASFCSELPVEQSMKLELIIIGKPAKTLGLKIPQLLLIMADKVTE